MTSRFRRAAGCRLPAVGLTNGSTAGGRRPVAPLVALVLLAVGFAGCRTLRLDQPTVTTEADWLTEGDSPQRRSTADVALTPPLEEVWAYNAGAGFGPGSPLLLGDAVIVATRKGEVHAIDYETGARLGLNSFGDAVEGTPAIGDGRLYVPVAWGRRALYAYDLGRGETRWSVRHAPIEAGLLLHEGTLYAVDVEANVRAYDPDDGDVRWERALGDTQLVLGAPVVAGPNVVVADDDGHVVALDARDGALAWTHDLETPVQATMAADARHLYIPTTRGRFVALDAATGEVRWRYVDPDTSLYLSPPAVSGDLVVFGGSDGVLRALDAGTGAVRWTFDSEEAVSAAPLITPEVVYFGNAGERLLAVDRRTGEWVWEAPVRGRIRSAPAAREGHLVVVSEGRIVYLFRSKTAGYASND